MPTMASKTISQRSAPGFGKKTKNTMLSCAFLLSGLNVCPIGLVVLHLYSTIFSKISDNFNLTRPATSLASHAKELRSDKLHLPLLAYSTGVLGDNEVKQVEEILWRRRGD